MGTAAWIEPSRLGSSVCARDGEMGLWWYWSWLRWSLISNLGRDDFMLKAFHSERDQSRVSTRPQARVNYTILLYVKTQAIRYY